MSKTVKITEEIFSKMKAVLGEDISAEKYSVYECRAVSTEPLSKKCSIMDGAVPSPNFIQMLLNMVRDTDRNISVHANHESDELSYGRVFDGWVSHEDNGVQALYVRFAMLNSDETKDIREKIEAGILDEVSIGFSVDSAKCSVCGFDYFDKSLSEEEFFEHYLSQTCPEGHKIGVDGCHLNVEATSDFYEVSIVNQGAAHHAKIQENKNFGLSRDNVRKFMFTARFGDKPMEEKKIDAELKGEIEEIKALLKKDQTAEIEKVVSEKEAEYSAKLAEKDAEIEALKATISELEKVSEDKTSELSANKKIFADEINKALTAAGKESVSEEAELPEMVKALHEAQVTLSASIPVGGKSVPAGAELEKADTLYGVKKYQLEAFKGAK